MPDTSQAPHLTAEEPLHEAEPAKSRRFNARLTEEQKRLFERAASLYGQSVSQFVMSSAQRAAEEAIREHDIIVLSAEDSLTIMEALLHPAPVGPRLRQAAERYKAMKRNR